GIEPQIDGRLGHGGLGSAGNLPAHLPREFGEGNSFRKILFRPERILLVGRAVFRLKVLASRRYLSHFLTSFACARLALMILNVLPRSVTTTTSLVPSSSIRRARHRSSP